MEENEGLLRTCDVARMLNFSRALVRNMAAKGEIPAYHVASEWRFDRAEIEQWLESRRNLPKAESEAEE